MLTENNTLSTRSCGLNRPRCFHQDEAETLRERYNALRIIIREKLHPLTGDCTCGREDCARCVAREIVERLS